MGRSLVFVALALQGMSAMAARSVWDEAKQSANQVIGKVFSIATNETEVLVRISDGNSTEIYKICSSYPGGDGLNLVETERMKSIRAAFNQGSLVKASYNSPFDRCLISVELNKEIQPATAVATKDGKGIKSANAVSKNRPSL